MEDVNLPGPSGHLCWKFFDRFPRLRAVEAGRRPVPENVSTALKSNGFTEVSSTSLWETRKTYEGFEPLSRDLAARTGRSILHELNDEELVSLIDYIQSQLPEQDLIIEKDRWTLWAA